MTGREARTLHRTLEYSPKKGGFQRNEDRPLAADLVIVDETSMWTNHIWTIEEIVRLVNLDYEVVPEI